MYKMNDVKNLIISSYIAVYKQITNSLKLPFHCCSKIGNKFILKNLPNLPLPLTFKRKLLKQFIEDHKQIHIYFECECIVSQLNNFQFGESIWIGSTISVHKLLDFKYIIENRLLPRLKYAIKKHERSMYFKIPNIRKHYRVTNYYQQPTIKIKMYVPLNIKLQYFPKKYFRLYAKNYKLEEYVKRACVRKCLYMFNM